MGNDNILGEPILKMARDVVSESPHAVRPFAPQGAVRPFPQDMRAPIEGVLGKDVSRLGYRLGARPSLFGADGLAQGPSIEIDPAVAGGGRLRLLRLLAHETKHIDQQQSGRAMPRGGGGGVLRDRGMENEADQFAQQVVDRARHAPPMDGSLGVADDNSSAAFASAPAILGASGGGAPIQLGKTEDGSSGSHDSSYYSKKALEKTTLWAIASNFGLTNFIGNAHLIKGMMGGAKMGPMMKFLNQKSVQNYGIGREVMGLPFDMLALYRTMAKYSGHDYDVTGALGAFSGIGSGIGAMLEGFYQHQGKTSLAHKWGARGVTMGNVHTALMPLVFYQLYQASRHKHDHHDGPPANPMARIARDALLYGMGMGAPLKMALSAAPYITKNPKFLLQNPMLQTAMNMRAFIGSPLLLMMLMQNFKDDRGRDTDATGQLAAFTGLAGGISPLLARGVKAGGYDLASEMMLRTGKSMGRMSLPLMGLYTMFNLRDWWKNM